MAEPSSSPGSVRPRWPLILAAWGVGVIAAAHIGKVPPAIPALREGLDLDLITAGWVVAMIGSTGLALGMVAGLLVDRIGARRMVLAGLGLMAAGSLAGAAATGGATLLASRFLEGVGFVCAVVGVPPILTDAAGPARRRFVLGLWGTFMPTGIAAMMLLAPAAIAASGWRGAWLLLGAVTLLWTAVIGTILARGGTGPGFLAGHGSRVSIIDNIRRTLTVPGPWLLALGFCVYTLAWMALMAWLPTFLVDERGLGVASASALTVAVVLVNVPGNMLGAWLLQAGARRWAMLAAAGVVIAATGPLAFLDLLPDAGRYAACLVFSFLAGMVPSAVFAGTTVFAPSERQIGTVNGLLVQGSHLGQFAGPPILAAAVTLSGGWSAGGWILVACGAALMALGVMVGIAEARLRPRSESPA